MKEHLINVAHDGHFIKMEILLTVIACLIVGVAWVFVAIFGAHKSADMPLVYAITYSFTHLIKLYLIKLKIQLNF